MLRFTLVCSLFILAETMLLAQGDFREGYILTLQSDTLFGQIEYRTNARNYQSCLFKDGRRTTEYTPQQINGFGFTNDKFYSAQVVDTTFVEVLVRGDLSLYLSQGGFLMQKDTLLLDLRPEEKKTNLDAHLKIEDDRKWKGKLAYILSDCLSDPNQLISNISLSEKQLTKLASTYNECRGSVYTVFKVSKPWSRVRVGVAAGAMNPNLNTMTSRGFFAFLDKTYRSIDPSIGVLISFTAPRISERTALSGELHYSRSTYAALIETGELTPVLHETHIELSTISLPFFLTYTFPAKKYRFFFQGGINYDFYLNTGTQLFSERISGNTVSTFPEAEAFDFEDKNVGFGGGIGISRNFQRFRTDLAIRFQRMSGLDQNTNLTITNNRLWLNLMFLL